MVSLKSFRAAFKSKQAFVKAIETRPDVVDVDDDRVGRNPWKNEDLAISPPKDRTWTWYDYASFWWTYGIGPSSWGVGSSLLAIGLEPWQAVVCIFIGYLFGGIGIALHSRSAAVYHFGFPVESRITWGLRGSYFPIILRCLTALVWTGVSIVTGGYHTAVFLRCIFGDSFWKMHNTIPASSGITLPDFIGLIVYWILTFPLLNIPVPKFRRWIEVEAVLMPICMFGLFIYCMVIGRGYPEKSISSGGTGGSMLGWAMLRGINYMMGKTSTLVINQPDIARYARNKNAPMLSQLISLPLANTAGAVLGIWATMSVYNRWGNVDWNLWILEHDILDNNWGPGARAGVAIIAAFQIFANALIDMAANIIPFGADFMTLFPRWLNIKRGMWVAYILGICICPWYILSSAFGFLTFLGGYSIFLGPFLGIFITDYFVVRKGNVYVEDLYNPKGCYWYMAGFNWRAAVAWALSVVWAIPGFSASFGNTMAGQTGWEHLYDFSWFFVCVLSSVLYYGLSHIGDYATVERAMHFEALALEQDEILNGVVPSLEASDVNVNVESKV